MRWGNVNESGVDMSLLGSSRFRTQFLVLM